MTKPSMTISHWGEIEAPTRVLPAVLIPTFSPGRVTVRYRQPLEYFDGVEWKLLAKDVMEWRKGQARALKGSQ